MIQCWPQISVLQVIRYLKATRALGRRPGAQGRLRFDAEVVASVWRRDLNSRRGILRGHRRLGPAGSGRPMPKDATLVDKKAPCSVRHGN